MKRTINTAIIGAAALVMTLGLGVGAANAESARAMIRVTATVAAYTNIDIQRQERVLNITESDIRRGYVEVSAATVLNVRTNLRDGYVLSFYNNGGPLKAVTIIDGARNIDLTGANGFAHFSTLGRRPGEEQTKELSYRFYLNEDAAAGAYAWPIQIGTKI